MIPTMNPPNNDYPHFVADQLLMAADLNNVFEYLDEGERMTRANLVGVGVVCGLEVTVNTGGTGTTIAVSRGCGVTSMGYLIAYSDEAKDKDGNNVKRSFTHFRSYNAFENKPEFLLLDGSDNFDNDDYYADRWLDKTVNPVAQIPLFELLTAGDDGATALSPAILSSKVLLALVELRKKLNKNCDPDSCDDRGETMEVTNRFLLIDATEANKLLAPLDAPELKLPAYLNPKPVRRFDVTATSIEESADIVQAYVSIFNNGGSPSLPKQVQDHLSAAYNDFFYLVKDISPVNPFSRIEADFRFLADGTLSKIQLLNIQYYHDFFSDLLQASKELNEAWVQVRGWCCPRGDLFPRHLFLGRLDIPGGADAKKYRTAFRPSRANGQQHEGIEKVRFLFRKLVLMVQKFKIPPAQSAPKTGSLDPMIRITPSTLGAHPFSKKAIPFYYDISLDTPALFEYWNYEKSGAGIGNQNLSYHSRVYNTADEFVREPLLYDLEPYNFLRIEGHVGKDYTAVLRSLLHYRTAGRLPFSVIALGADFNTVRYLSRLNEAEMFDAVNRLLSTTELEEAACHFNDLQTVYESIIAEFTCTLCKEMKYFYDFDKLRGQEVPADRVPAVPLLKRCDPLYRYAAGTTGEHFEVFFERLRKSPEISAEFFLRTFESGATSIAAVSANSNLLLLALLYFMEMLSETFEERLPAFEYEKFEEQNNRLVQVAVALKRWIISLTENGEANAAVSRYEDILDHIDVLIYLCKKAALRTLVAEYRKRFVQLFSLRKFGYFIQKHPGIQHKAGVPLGGTFVLVYHEEGTVDKDENEKPEEPPVKVEKVRLPITGRVVQSSAAVPVGATITATDISTGNKLVSVTTNFTGRFGLYPGVLPVKLTIQPTGSSKTFELLAKSLSLGVIDLDSLPRRSEAVKGNSRIHIMNEAIGGKAPVSDDLRDGFEEISEGTVIADFFLPYLCCSDCPPVEYRVDDRPVQNAGPVANAGPDQTIVLPTNRVSLDGSTSSDPDGTIASFEWSQVSGPGTATITAPGDAKTGVENLVQGAYVFQLRVADDKGAAATDMVIVTVAPPPNKAPVANAGDDQVLLLPVNKTELDGSASADPEGRIASFSWAQKSGPQGAVIEQPDASKTVVSGLQAGSYVFELTVVDEQGLSAKDDVQIQVNRRPNEPPIANAGPDRRVTFGTNNPVVLDGSASKDPDGTIVAFEWKQLSGEVQTTINGGDKPKASVSGFRPGRYIYELRVTDNEGATAVDEVVLVVDPPASRPPVANAGEDQTVTAGPNLLVVLDGSRSADPDGQIQSFSWQQVLGPGPANIAGADTARASVTNLAPGSYKFDLTVKDDQGLSDTASVNVVVTRPDRRPPVANAGDDRRVSPTDTNRLVLDGSNSKDEDGEIVGFKWRQTGGPAPADIETPDAAQTAIASLLPGVYTFELTVTDSDGLTTSDTVIITVTEQPVATTECLPLGGVMEDFLRLPSIAGADLFQRFIAAHKNQRVITEYFRVLAPVPGMPVDKQIEFFAKPVALNVGDIRPVRVNVLIAEALPEWLTTLFALVQEQRETRLVALSLYRVLVRLAVYIACIQKDDIGNAKVPMMNFFEAGLLSEIVSLRNTPLPAQLTGDERAVLQLLLADLTAEVTRLKESGQDGMKTVYNDILRRVVKTLAPLV